jgi:outer membrane protein OmpA-like peptidoglycan-associated protein
MMPIFWKSFLSVLLLALAGSAMAQQAKDKPGCRDNDVIGRYAGSVLLNCGQQAYEEIEAPLGPVRIDSASQRLLMDKSVKAGGKLFHYLYREPAQHNSLEVYRNYEQALKAKGFTILYGCEQIELCGQQRLQYYARYWTGGDKSRTTFAGGYSPLSYMDDRPARYLVASREAPEGNLYVTLTTKDVNGGLYYLQVLEERKMQMDAVRILDAKTIGSELQKAGKVALYGIEFDTNSASIRADSLPQLQQMADVLKAQGQLKVFIVGHTDNVGTYEHNRALSQRRAQSVTDALGSQGIDKARLQAVGVANVAPVASNDSDAGRAKNRRVEMVVQ